MGSGVRLCVARARVPWRTDYFPCCGPVSWCCARCGCLQQATWLHIKWGFRTGGPSYANENLEFSPVLWFRSDRSALFRSCLIQFGVFVCMQNHLGTICKSFDVILCQSNLFQILVPQESVLLLQEVVLASNFPNSGQPESFRPRLGRTILRDLCTKWIRHNNHKNRCLCRMDGLCKRVSCGFVYQGLSTEMHQ